MTQALLLYSQKLRLEGVWRPSVCGQGAVRTTAKEAQDGRGALLQQHPPAGMVPADPHDTPESHAALLPTPQVDIGSRWAVASEGHAGARQKRVPVSSLLGHSQGRSVLLAASQPQLSTRSPGPGATRMAGTCRSWTCSGPADCRTRRWAPKLRSESLGGRVPPTCPRETDIHILLGGSLLHGLGVTPQSRSCPPSSPCHKSRSHYGPYHLHFLLFLMHSL